MSNIYYKHVFHHFQFTSQESKMIATPASAERVQKCNFNFEIYRFLKKKRPIYLILPHRSPLIHLNSELWRENKPKKGRYRDTNLSHPVPRVRIVAGSNETIGHLAITRI